MSPLLTALQVLGTILVLTALVAIPSLVIVLLRLARRVRHLESALAEERQRVRVSKR
jgi:hypothetical protein